MDFTRKLNKNNKNKFLFILFYYIILLILYFQLIILLNKMQMHYNYSFINNEFLDFFERGKLEFELYDDDIN